VSIGVARAHIVGVLPAGPRHTVVVGIVGSWGRRTVVGCSCHIVDFDFDIDLDCSLAVVADEQAAERSPEQALWAVWASLQLEALARPSGSLHRLSLSEIDDGISKQ